MSRTKKAYIGSGRLRHTADTSTGKVMPDKVRTSVAKLRTGNCWRKLVLSTPQSTAPRCSQRSRFWPTTCEEAVRPSKAMPSSLTLLIVPEVSVSSQPSGKRSMASLSAAEDPASCKGAATASRVTRRTRNCAPPSWRNTVADTVQAEGSPATRAEHISMRPVASAMRSKDCTSPWLSASKHSRTSRPTRRLPASLSRDCAPTLASSTRWVLASTINTASEDVSNSTR